MKKRILSALLCAALVLLLAACGGSQAGGNSTEPSTEGTSSGQQTTEPESTQPEETEPAETKPTETEPEETKPTETEPEETQPTETAPEASAFLALLQAEYQSDTALGLTGQHAFFSTGILLSQPVYLAPELGNYRLFSFGDTIYGFCENDRTWFAYDLATKTQTQLTGPDMEQDDLRFVFDGAVYYMDGSTLIRDDLQGNTVNISKPEEYRDFSMLYYGGGILYYSVDLSKDIYLYTMDLQKIASIPAPQQEAAHGLTETVQLDPRTLCAAGGKIYATDNRNIYSLDPTAATPEWTDIGEVSAQPDKYFSRFQDFVLSGGATAFSQNFLGRYYYSRDDRCFYDITTGETVFELGELYAPVEGDIGGKIYFGGDSYIGYKDKEYRIVNLANDTMSEPLPLPENYLHLYFLNDTYCVYDDQYGIFLWNYLTGEETTIVMYEQN